MIRYSVYMHCTVKAKFGTHVRSRSFQRVTSENVGSSLKVALTLRYRRLWESFYLSSHVTPTIVVFTKLSAKGYN